MGSKVERVNKSKETKTSKAQIEIVDWALETRWTELVRLRRVLNVIEGFNFLPLISSSSSSSGKKIRKKPIPQISAALVTERRRRMNICKYRLYQQFSFVWLVVRTLAGHLLRFSVCVCVCVFYYMDGDEYIWHGVVIVVLALLPLSFYCLIVRLI